MISIYLYSINMAEKLSTSTFDINHPRKRRLVEEKFDVTPATLYIERIDISKSPNVTTISEQQFAIASSKFLIRVLISLTIFNHILR